MGAAKRHIHNIASLAAIDEKAHAPKVVEQKVSKGPKWS